MSRFTYDSIPAQHGRIAVVTGANAGIGFETARGLAERGAHVVLACRNPEKGREAVARIEALRPEGRVELRALDLSDLDSVHTFADGLLADHARLDLLVHNAGVMVPPYAKTKQGFELQLGTNHLGHFALGARLLPRLRETAGSRLVVVYSGAYLSGRIHFDDLHYERRMYIPWLAYSQSKLANVLYATELRRRLAGVPGAPMVTLAHPGWTATDLQRNMSLAALFNPLLAMKAPDGALPTLRAATDPDAVDGGAWGPAWAFEMTGPPVPAHILRSKLKTDVAARLWSVSEELTGVRYDLPASVSAQALH